VSRHRRRHGTGAAIAADAVVERAEFVQTLRSVGPAAPTLAGTWTASDIARHVAAQDRLAGVPALLARGLVVRTGLRLTEPYRRSARLGALLDGPPRSWEWSLDRLHRPPPRAVLRPRIAPITLWEHFVHHEDIRRPAGRARTSRPELSGVLRWLLQYYARRLRGVSLRLVDEHGRERRAGNGSEVAVAGPLEEIVLWLSGRHVTATVDVTGDRRVIGALQERLAV
jgi:uncharacterized protein (TIGR03085 family)